jgi:hypothetical protein
MSGRTKIHRVDVQIDGVTPYVYSNVSTHQDTKRSVGAVYVNGEVAGWVFGRRVNNYNATKEWGYHLGAEYDSDEVMRSAYPQRTMSQAVEALVEKVAR